MRSPQRWEVAYFTLTNAVPTVSGTLALTGNILALPQNFGDTSTAQGRSLNNAMRSLEIGGIVFNWNVFLNQSGLEGISAHALAWCALYSDRTNANLDPASIPDLSNNTLPVVGAASTVTADADYNYPTRIHWRENRVFPIGDFDVGLAQAQVALERPRSLRLRLRCDEEHGLFVAYNTLQSTGSAANFTHVFSGHYYYRFRF